MRNDGNDISPVCALVGSAGFDAAHFSRERFGCVAAVDGGYASLSASGIVPDVAIGDFDSLGYVPSGVPVVRHPCEKDDSDTALALAWARGRGFGAAAVYGALGGRLDHTQATYAALLGAARAGMRVVAIGEGSLVALLCADAPDAPDGLVVAPDAAAPGAPFSLFPIGGPARGVSISGAKYETRGVDIACDVTLGLSNEFDGRPVRISLLGGALLAFLPACPLSSLAWGMPSGERPSRAL